MCENTVVYFEYWGNFDQDGRPSYEGEWELEEMFGICGQTNYDGNRLLCYDCTISSPEWWGKEEKADA